MKYEFKGNYIVATAETLQENALLISTQGALQPEVVKVPTVKKSKAEKKQKRSRINETDAEILRKKVDDIPRYSTTLIPKEIANLSSNFFSFAGNRLKRIRKVPYKVRKVEAGYEITIE